MLEILDLVFPNLIIQAMIKAFIRYLQTAALKVTLSIRTLCRSHTQIIFNLLVILSSSIVVLACLRLGNKHTAKCRWMLVLS